MQIHLKELRDIREQYEAVIGEKVIGAGYQEMNQEALDKIELVNAVRG